MAETHRHLSSRFSPLGDSALVVEYGNSVNPQINDHVLALGGAVEKAKPEGVEELVPTYRSMLIRFNPLKTSYEKLVFAVRDAETAFSAKLPQIIRKSILVPVMYGGQCGPDLKAVAKIHGLTEADVIRLHSSVLYRVYMIGFVAGFPYLGELPDEIATPRLDTPRTKVPAGSVGIAGKQTGIYPCDAPGGWRIIGKTPIKLFDPCQEPPAKMQAGDLVRFIPVSAEAYEKLA